MKEIEFIRTMRCPFCGYTYQTRGISSVYCGPHGIGKNITPAVQMMEIDHEGD